MCEQRVKHHCAVGPQEPSPFLEVIIPWRETEKTCPLLIPPLRRKQELRLGFSQDRGAGLQVLPVKLRHYPCNQAHCCTIPAGSPKGQPVSQPQTKAFSLMPFSTLLHCLFTPAFLITLQAHLPVGRAWHNPPRHISALREEGGHTSLCPQSQTKASPPRERAASSSVGHRIAKGTITFMRNTLLTRP